MKKLISAALLSAMLFGSAACSAGNQMVPIAPTAASNARVAQNGCGAAQARMHAEAAERVAMCVTCPDGTIADTCSTYQPPGWNSGPPNGGGGGSCPPYVMARRAKTTSTSCGTTGGGGGGVATIPGAAPAGATCSGSPDTNKVGENNMPANSNTWATTIANVFGFENANGEVFGWVYVTENQSVWFQRNSADTGAGALLSFFDNIPGVNGIAQTLINATTSPSQLTGQQWQNIQQSMANSGFLVHKCYTKNYTGTGTGS